MEIDEDLRKMFNDSEVEIDDIVVKFEEVYPHEEFNLLHCMAVHYGAADFRVPICLQRDVETRCCTHREYHPIITALSNQDVEQVKQVICRYGLNDYMRMWKGTIDDNNRVCNKPRNPFDIILKYDNLELLKIMLEYYKGHLYPVFRMIEEKYFDSRKCSHAIVTLMNYYDHGHNASVKFPGEEDHDEMDCEEDDDELDP